jgi:hypothetical protein
MKTEWFTTISVLNKTDKHVSVSATRIVTDDSDPDPLNWVIISRWQANPVNGIIDTGAQKTAIMNDIWSQWQAYLTEQSEASTLIGSLEADAKSNLEAREP